MFRCIQIKQDSSTGYPSFDIASLIDAMLYYQEVIIIASHLELNYLLDVIGEDNLLELLKTKRLILKLNCQHFGVGFPDVNLITVGNYSVNIHDVDKLLYYDRSHVIKDHNACVRFVDKFAPLVQLYEFPLLINDLYYSEFEDSRFMSQLANQYLIQMYPEYNLVGEVSLVMTKSTDWEGFYTIESNLDIDKLNQIHKQRGLDYSFNFSNLLFGVGNTNMDLYSAAEFGSELDPDPRYGFAYGTRMNACIEKAKASNSSISNFENTFAYGYLSIGKAYEAGVISMEDVLKLLNNKNSELFREWVCSLDDNTNLSGEFVNECKERLKDGRLIKAERLAIKFAFVGAALLGVPFNPWVGAGWTAVDTFVLNKLSSGWTPAFFQDRILRNRILKP